MSDLHDAAEEGRLETVRRILKEQPQDLNATSPLGDTPLHLAASQQHTRVVQFLLKQGADLDRKGNQGNTPLHYAADAGSVDVVKILLQHGADLEVKNDRGQTPLLVAAHHIEVGRPITEAVVKLLLKRGATYDIESAVVLGDVARVRDLLTSYPKLLEKLPREKHVRLIHLAVDKPEIMHELLQHGGDPNAASKRGYFRVAPLLRVSDPIVAELLLQHGADANARNAKGETRLQLARRFSESALEEVLLRAEKASTKPRPRKQ
jgi:ankyrin repeat protein